LKSADADWISLARRLLVAAGDQEGVGPVLRFWRENPGGKSLPPRTPHRDRCSGAAEESEPAEDKANGPAVVRWLRHEFAGYVEVNPEGGKVSRAAAASPQLESGNWYLLHPRLAP
jgi:hypothetical protein